MSDGDDIDIGDIPEHVLRDIEKITEKIVSGEVEPDPFLPAKPYHLAPNDEGEIAIRATDGGSSGSVDMTLQATPLYGDDECHELTPPTFDETTMCKPVPMAQQMRVFREYGLEDGMEDDEHDLETEHGEVMRRGGVFSPKFIMRNTEDYPIRVTIEMYVQDGWTGCSSAKLEPGAQKVISGLGAGPKYRASSERLDDQTTDDTPEVGDCVECGGEVAEPSRYTNGDVSWWMAGCLNQMCGAMYLKGADDLPSYLTKSCHNWPDEWGDAPDAMTACHGCGTKILVPCASDEIRTGCPTCGREHSRSLDGGPVECEAHVCIECNGPEPYQRAIGEKYTVECRNGHTDTVPREEIPNVEHGSPMHWRCTACHEHRAIRLRGDRETVVDAKVMPSASGLGRCHTCAISLPMAQVYETDQVVRSDSPVWGVYCVDCDVWHERKATGGPVLCEREGECAYCAEGVARDQVSFVADKKGEQDANGDMYQRFADHLESTDFDAPKIVFDHRVRGERDDHQPDPDVLGYLHSRYGCEPEFDVWHETHPPSEFYQVSIGVLDLTFEPMGDVPGWNWTIEWVSGARACRQGHDTLSDACDAADDAVRELLEETREVVGE